MRKRNRDRKIRQKDIKRNMQLKRNEKEKGEKINQKRTTKNRERERTIKIHKYVESKRSICILYIHI